MIIRIEQGDDIQHLALRWFGDWRAWDWLYATNQETIGDDPFALLSGMELELIQPPIAEQRLSYAAMTTWNQIARDAYGYESLWPRILRKNLAVSPEAILSATTVVCPAIVSVAQLKNAADRRKRMAGND